MLRVRETLKLMEDIIGDLGAAILFLTNRTRQQYQRRKTTVNVKAAVIAEEKRFIHSTLLLVPIFITRVSVGDKFNEEEVELIEADVKNKKHKKHKRKDE